MGIKFFVQQNSLYIAIAITVLSIITRLTSITAAAVVVVVVTVEVVTVRKSNIYTEKVKGEKKTSMT